MISLSQKQSDAWHFLEDNSINEVLYGGGAGSGKSYLGCLWHIFRRMTYPGTRGVIGRSKISILEQSTLITLFKAASDYGYISGEHYVYNSQKHIISWCNGSTTILKDLFLYPSDPDFTSLGSTEYTDAFIDEVNEVSRKAVEILKSRLRYKLTDYNLSPSTLMTCNPAPGWVKDDYVVKDNKTVELKPYQRFVQALVTDNPDKEFAALYIEQLERMSSDYDKARLLHGEWEVDREVLNPFMFAYDKHKHESREAVFDSNKTLYISIDFNLTPFAVIFGHIWRDNNGEHCHIFDEFTIPKGSIPLMIDEIKDKYYPSLKSCFLAGDSMGNRGEISQRDNASLYLQLQRGLGLNNRQMRVMSNPTHENSRVECSVVMRDFPDFKVNPETCPNLCRDNKIVQCDAFGSIIKKNRNDLSQLADHFDCERYFFHSFLREWIYKTMKSKKR